MELRLIIDCFEIDLGTGKPKFLMNVIGFNGPSIKQLKLSGPKEIFSMVFYDAVSANKYEGVSRCFLGIVTLKNQVR